MYIIWPTTGKQKLKINIPENCDIGYRPEGSWMDSTLMIRWVNSVLRRYSRKLPADKKGLLLLDNHESHKGPKFEKSLKEIRFDVLYLPPNCISQL